MFGRSGKFNSKNTKQELASDEETTDENIHSACVDTSAVDETIVIVDEGMNPETSGPNAGDEGNNAVSLDEAATIVAQDNEMEKPEEVAVERMALENLDSKLTELIDLFHSKIEHSDYELEVARRYSEELQEYRNDLYQSILDPLIRKMVILAGGMFKAEEMAMQRQEDAIPLDTFSLYREELEDTLADFEIEPFAPEEGAAFISGDHKIAGEGIPTSDQSKARCIAEVKSKGYRSPKKVYAPAKVRVFAFECASENIEINENAEQAFVGDAEVETSEQG